MECALRASASQVAVFDPGRSYSGLFDKGPSDLRPVAQFLRRIQNETQCKTLVLINHDIKPRAVAPEGQEPSRSQQASGGGIFSISDCPVSFTKLDWNKVAVYPEDYKLCGDPKPFEVTFETEEWTDDNGALRFGSWIRPVAVTKDEQNIKESATRKKILDFLNSHPGEWFIAQEVERGAHTGTDSARSVLRNLFEEGLVLHVTGKEAIALGRASAKAKLYSAVVSAVVEPHLEGL